MTKLFILLCVLLSLSSFAGTQLEEKALGLIDDICGDTWCEGDFDYSFNKLKCNFQTEVCELGFQFKYEDEPLTDEELQYSLLMTFDRKCILTGVKENNIIESKYNLTHNFYEKVSECISEKEEEIFDFLDTYLKYDY